MITKEYAEKLKQKLATFKKYTKNKQVGLYTMVVPNGIKKNQYFDEFSRVVTLDDLFVDV